jgi:hypothetical protein
VIAIAVIDERESRRALQGSIDENFDLCRRRTVFVYADSSGDILHTGLASHASGLASTDVTCRVLVIVTYRRGRQRTTQREDRPGVGVSSVPAVAAFEQGLA